MTNPAWSLVAALNSLQKPMMLTPCWPNAGPTGGAGLAWPAGICNLICPVTFFAIKIFFKPRMNTDSTASFPFIRVYRRLSVVKMLRFFHLPIFQFNWSVSSKNVHGHLQFAAIRLNLFDDAAEVQEWAVVDLDRFSDFKIHFRFFVIFGFRNLRFDRVNFFRRRRSGTISAHESDDTLRIADEIPWLFDDAMVLIQQNHINEHVARIKFARRHSFLAATHLSHFLHGNEDLFDQVTHFLGLDPLFNAFFDLLFLAGQRMDDKPLAFHCRRIQ